MLTQGQQLVAHNQLMLLIKSLRSAGICAQTASQCVGPVRLVIHCLL